MKTRQFNRYIYKYRRIVAVIILLEFIFIPLTLLNPYLTKFVIDKAYAYRDIKLFFILVIIVGTILVLNGFISALIGYLSQRVSHLVNFDITKDLFNKLHDLAISFFNEKSAGEHVYKITNDTACVSELICSTMLQLAALFVRFIFILLIIFYLNWKLMLFASVLVLVSYLHNYFLKERLRQISANLIHESESIYDKLCETFSHMHLIKAYNREEYEIEKIQKNLQKRLDFEIKKARLLHINNFSSGILNKVIGGIVILYGGYQVIKGTVSLGNLTAVMIYMTQMMFLIESMGGLYQRALTYSVSAQRLTKIFDMENKILDKKDAINHPILRGRIDVVNLSFGYKEDFYVLKNLNLFIKEGAKIALVGPSGCGKTTFLGLILRLYEPQKGSVLIDGLDTRNIKAKIYREKIGMAFQQPLLWNDTVLNNILYGKDNAKKDEAIKAAHIAQAHDFIMELPNQYETIIGETACKISEGQKQRIALARALIKEPRILILDEAMSSLDSQTEDKIVSNIMQEFDNATLIVVTHILSTVKKMELVYFLDNTDFFNQQTNIYIGTHQELAAKNERYIQLFASQNQEQLNQQKFF